MNQVLRQNAKTSVEKDFNKLMNNSNFAYDCRNNVDNCSFTPILDEIEELSYAKRYQNIFDQNIDLLEKQIEEEFTNRIATLDQQSEYYKARKNLLVIKKKSSMPYFRWKDPVKKHKKLRQRYRIKNKRRGIRSENENNIRVQPFFVL